MAGGIANSIVVAIDAKQVAPGKWEIFTHGGRKATGIDAVAYAIGDHYRPRFAGDELPSNAVGVAVALAEGPANRSRQARLNGTSPAERRRASSSARKAS